MKPTLNRNNFGHLRRNLKKLRYILNFCWHSDICSVYFRSMFAESLLLFDSVCSAHIKPVPALMFPGPEPQLYSVNYSPGDGAVGCPEEYDEVRFQTKSVASLLFLYILKLLCFQSLITQTEQCEGHQLNSLCTLDFFPELFTEWLAELSLPL